MSENHILILSLLFIVWNGFFYWCIYQFDTKWMKFGIFMLRLEGILILLGITSYAIYSFL